MKRFKIGLILLLFSTIFILGSCSNVIDYKDYEGTYLLESAKFDNLDVKDEYLLYQITLESNQNMIVSINYLGIITSRNSTYSIKKEVLTEIYGNETYTYQVDLNNQTLTHTYYDNCQVEIILKKQQHSDIKDQGVNFNSILFGESINLTKRFNYAPAIIMEKDGDGQDIMHIWYCTNKNSGIIVDHIAYRKGVKTKDDKWKFSEEEIVLAPTENTWDSRHVCDPTVIKGEFLLNDNTYHYMMSYLGCTTDDYSKNETGIAVSHSPAGPWIKVEHLNPIVPWSQDNNHITSWGTGMPILISADQKGKVLLFYSSSSIGVGVQYWDFNNLNNPIKIFTRTMNSNGAKNPNGTSLGLAIADFGYDEVKGRFYIASRTATKNPPDITRTRVDSHIMLAYIDGFETIGDVVNKLETQDFQWKVLGYIGPEETGYERNHNVGLVKDEYGRIYNSDNIMMVISTGHNSWPNENIFTYRLLGYIYKLI